MSKDLFQDKKLFQQLYEVTRLDPSLYPLHSIKQGLRNENGTGVLVGLTRIAGVYGYEIKDGKKIPAKGRLLYRGIDIETIVSGIQKDGRFGFEETTFLLLFGVLPTEEQLREFQDCLNALAPLPEHFKEDVFFKIPSRNLMNKLQRVLLTLYSYDEAADDISLANTLRQSLSIIAKMPTILAYAYRAKLHYFDGESLIIHNHRPEYSIAENVLHLIRDDSTFERWEAELLDLCLIVQAEHGGGNNSTFTTHVVSSTGTDTYSALSAAVGSLKGPKHGGANAKVMGMIRDMKQNCNWRDRASLRDYMRKILRKEAYDGMGLIYGMGHAVYTISDPRAQLLKKRLQELSVRTHCEDEVQLLENIESITHELMHDAHREAPICANVDLYTGLLYRMLKIPDDLATPLFALARMGGWCAHRLEQLSDKKIMRPAYVTIGEEQHYLPIKERSFE
ncbi:MAG: citrate synthase [Peptoniphilaceae bacterium]|nr:citrate synthase [Peptoniphilaceae bacterium]